MDSLSFYSMLAFIAVTVFIIVMDTAAWKK